MKVGRPKGVKDKVKRCRKGPLKSDIVIGKKFTRWLVLERAPGYKNRKATYFKVLCDCGVIKFVEHASLVLNKSQSCGCLHKERLISRQTKPNNYAAIHKVFTSYRAGARQRGHLFELSKDELVKIITQNCYYCDKPPNLIKKTVGGQIHFNGIDRVDNRLGYILSNCVPCCSDCNYMKQAVTKNIIIKAYEFLTTSK